MPAFPFTSPKPDANGFGQNVATDPTLRTEFENGIVETRSAFTTVPDEWTIKHTQLSNTNKLSVETMYKTTTSYGSLVFDWTHPITATVYSVRFKGPPKYDVEPHGDNTWVVSFTVVEVP